VYDAADRLLLDTGGSGNVFTYDAIGNIFPNSSTRYDLPAPHALAFDGTFSYQYDPDGNRKRKEGAGLIERTTYTPFNKPSEIWNEDSKGKKTNDVTFLYDADQVRARKRTDSMTTVYSAGYERRASRTDETVNHVYYVKAGDRIVAQATLTEGSSTPRLSFLQSDNLGTPTMITDDAGHVTELDYDSFGVPRNPDWSGSAVPANTTGVSIAFTGQEDDSEHGLVNMGGRIYDPRTRQFTSPDPVQHVRSASGMNRYLYALGNPLRYVDPSGFDELDSEDITPDDLGGDAGAMTDAEFQDMVSDIVGDYDATGGPGLDPIASVTDSVTGAFESQSMCMVTSKDPLAGTVFDVIGHGGGAGPFRIMTLAEYLQVTGEPAGISPNPTYCAQHQCLWGNGDMTDAENYREWHKANLRTWAEQIAQTLVISSAYVSAVVPLYGQNHVGPSEVQETVERTEGLRPQSELGDQHNGFNETKEQNLAPNEFLNTPQADGYFLRVTPEGPTQPVYQPVMPIVVPFD
jgi:RHS repeat-associated protein